MPLTPQPVQVSKALVAGSGEVTGGAQGPVALQGFPRLPRAARLGTVGVTGAVHTPGPLLEAGDPQSGPSVTAPLLSRDWPPGLLSPSAVQKETPRQMAPCVASRSKAVTVALTPGNRVPGRSGPDQFSVHFCTANIFLVARVLSFFPQEHTRELSVRMCVHTRGCA